MLIEINNQYKQVVAFVVETEDKVEFLVLRKLICNQYSSLCRPVVYRLKNMKQVLAIAAQNVPMYSTTLTVNRILTGLKMPNKLITARNVASNVQYN